MPRILLGEDSASLSLIKKKYLNRRALLNLSDWARISLMGKASRGMPWEMLVRIQYSEHSYIGD